MAWPTAHASTGPIWMATSVRSGSCKSGSRRSGQTDGGKGAGRSDLRSGPKPMLRVRSGPERQSGDRPGARFKNEFAVELTRKAEQVIVDRRHLNTALEQLSHDGIHLVRRQHQVAHYYRARTHRLECQPSA